MSPKVRRSERHTPGKSLLSSRPVLWFLCLFNLVVALAAPLIVDGAQGIATGIGMAVVSIGAGFALFGGKGGGVHAGRG